jgi:hypothetical protein
LKIYNSALLLVGERSISSLTVSEETRRLLDTVWDDDGVRACLSSAQWKFAMRSVQIDYDASIDTEFGYNRAFTKPTDWCLTSAVCSDEYFRSPLLQVSDENGNWYCDLDTIYVRYVSDNSNFGGDLSLWPAKFTEFVASHFASKIVMRLTGDKVKQDFFNDPRNGYRRRMLDAAKSHDSMADPTKFLPRGSWTRARHGGTRRDNGSRGTLTG